MVCILRGPPKAPSKHLLFTIQTQIHVKVQCTRTQHERIKTPSEVHGSDCYADDQNEQLKTGVQ
jgi:hypothetical protein